MIGFLTRFNYLTRILLNLLCWKIFCKLCSSSGNQSLLSRNTGKRKNLLNENVLLELKSSSRNCMYQNEYRILLSQATVPCFLVSLVTNIDRWMLSAGPRHTGQTGLTLCSGGRWGRRRGHVGWFWATESQATWEPRQNKIVGSFTRNDTNKIFQWEINW